MQTLTESMGKTTDDIETFFIVSWSGTQKGVFPTTNFEMKIIILKIVKKCYFLPKNGKLTFEHDK